MFIEFKKIVASLLKEALSKAGYEADDLALEAKGDYADLASSVSFRLAPRYKASPTTIAQRIARNIPKSGLIERVEVAGPYINFFVDTIYLSKTLQKVAEEGRSYGNIGLRQKVILEHTSANPNGPLHIGHVRNSIVGDVLARCLKRAGCDVETHYYVNDMGRQIALVVWGLMQFDLDQTKKPDHATAEIYIRANAEMELQPTRLVEVSELMRNYERGDADTSCMFQDAVKFCLLGIVETLKNLDVEHDTFVWESEFLEDISGLIRDLKQRDYIKEDGPVMVDLSKSGMDKELVIRRSDGTSVYPTRDIAYHIWKAGRCSCMIDVLGADHKLNAMQVGKVLELLGVKPPKVVIFEFVSLPEGSMSTRRGHFVSADDVLEEVTNKAYEEVDKRRPDISEDEKWSIAQAVAKGAVRYDIASVSVDKPTIFDWKEALDFERQGGPFIQYAHARAANILAKADDFDGSYNPELLTDEFEINLIKVIAKFTAAIENVSLNLRPHTLAGYARELAEAFNQFYRYNPVLSAEPGVREARLGLVYCSKIVLRNTLECLGIEAIESM
jgi:arginyl-tRNA synthetase